MVNFYRTESPENHAQRHFLKKLESGIYGDRREIIIQPSSSSLPTTHIADITENVECTASIFKIQ